MLRQARWLHKKAEDATMKGRYEEAMQKHHEAAEILQNLLNDIIREKTRQAVDLQAEFHAKEELLLEQHQKRIDAIERLLHQLRLVQRDIEMNSRKSVTLDLNASSATLHRSATSSTTNTVSAGTPNEDYGFNQLRAAKKKSGGILKTASNTSASGSKEQFFNFGKSSTSSALSASRRGSLKMGLDELETANCHLRRMVDSLFVELEHCQRENSQLRGRIFRMEGEINHSLAWHREQYLIREQQREQQHVFAASSHQLHIRHHAPPHQHQHPNTTPHPPHGMFARGGSLQYLPQAAFDQPSSPSRGPSEDDDESGVGGGMELQEMQRKILDLTQRMAQDQSPP